MSEYELQKIRNEYGSVAESLHRKLNIARKNASEFYFLHWSPSNTPLPSWWEKDIESCNASRCVGHAILPDGTFRADPRIPVEDVIKYVTLSEKLIEADQAVNAFHKSDLSNRIQQSGILGKVRTYRKKLIRQWSDYNFKKEQEKIDRQKMIEDNILRAKMEKEKQSKKDKQNKTLLLIGSMLLLG